MQRELPGGVLAEIGFNSNRFVNNWRSIDGEPGAAGARQYQQPPPLSHRVVPDTGDVITLANITRIQKDGWSQYHALQTKVEKRYATGISLLASYTCSKTSALEGGYQDYNNIAAEVGPHLRTTVRTTSSRAASTNCRLARERAFGREWSACDECAARRMEREPDPERSPRARRSMSSVAGNPSNSAGPIGPNVVGDWQLDEPDGGRWFNTEAFVANAPFTFGNAPKNLIRGPGTFNLDLVLRKSFRLSQGVSADLRFESFNLTNAAQLGNPNTAARQPELRPHLVGGHGAQQPGRRSSLLF